MNLCKARLYHPLAQSEYDVSEDLSCIRVEERSVQKLGWIASTMSQLLDGTSSLWLLDGYWRLPRWALRCCNLCGVVATV